MRHQDQFGIQLRPGKSQSLRTNLVELPIATPLRALMAKHRTHVVQAFATAIQQRVFDRRTYHASRIFRAQCQSLAIELIFKGIHFLLDNIGHFPKTAHEQGGGFDDGRANILVGVTAHDIAHHAFQGFPTMRLRRENVIHAFNGIDLFRFTNDQFFYHRYLRY